MIMYERTTPTGLQRKSSALVCGLMLLVAASSTSGPAVAAIATTPNVGLYTMLDASWAGHSRWDDGKAEVNLYAATLRREYDLRDAAYVASIVVKETFTPEHLVKADDWSVPGNFDVLKLNDISFAETGLYNWNQMASTFVERQRWVPIKMTFSRQEWCGNVFKEWRRWRDQRSLFTSSYFDGQGTRMLELPLDDAVVPYDSLPLLLRSIRLDGEAGNRTASFSMLPSLSGSRVGPTEAVGATLTAGDAHVLQVPLGSFLAVPLVLVFADDAGAETSETYWIEQAAPNRLIKLQRGNGETMALLRSERLQYWRMTGKDFNWLPTEALTAAP